MENCSTVFLWVIKVVVKSQYFMGTYIFDMVHIWIKKNMYAETCFPTANYFRNSTSSWMLDSILNMPLVLWFRWTSSTAQKMKFFIKDFLVNMTKFAEICVLVKLAREILNEKPQFLYSASIEHVQLTFRNFVTGYLKVL